MNIEDALKKVSIIGAAGKMGSGIAYLLLQEMARQEAQLTGNVGEGDYRLILLDTNDQGFHALKRYLRRQLTKFAERNIIALREWYVNNPKVTDNEEIIKSFVDGACDMMRFGCSLEETKGSHLIFEAIVEDISAKASVFAAIDTICGKETMYLTNTSSIPISVLREESHLGDRLMGFHFYNPPAVQKLLEIIIPEDTEPQRKELAVALAKRLKKTLVFSRDVAGFIGNGHLMREIAFACDKVNELSQSIPLTEAIYTINKMTQEHLIRPMGIFQLLDYVGIDIYQRIANIMMQFLPKISFKQNVVDNMAKEKIWGGQYADGSQKNGFFLYENNIPQGIFDLKKKTYLPFLKGNWVAECDKRLGNLPDGHLSWKKMSRDPHHDEKLKNYFRNLFQDTSLGSELAKEFLNNSREIAINLVNDGVAAKMEDVNTVLKNGFFHLYGADAPFLFEHECIKSYP
jgi:3-hydroxyacyl-CoA dehydrogenase